MRDGGGEELGSDRCRCCRCCRCCRWLLLLPARREHRFRGRSLGDKRVSWSYDGERDAGLPSCAPPPWGAVRDATHHRPTDRPTDRPSARRTESPSFLRRPTAAEEKVASEVEDRPTTRVGTSTRSFRFVTVLSARFCRVETFFPPPRLASHACSPTTYGTTGTASAGARGVAEGEDWRRR